jgi:DNA-binding transcriptional LysR family regulator
VAPIESVANGLLPRIIAEYHIARPAIELRVREGVHGAVLEDIRSGVADLGITFVDELPDTIAMVPLGREVFHAVMPRQHRLAPSRGVTMKQIGREPLVSLPNDSRTRRTIDAAASKQGITDEGAVSRGQPSWLCLGRSSERNCGTGMIMRRFAPDSALEQRGFELTVPP